MRGVTFWEVSRRAAHDNFNSHASCEAWLSGGSPYRPNDKFQLTRLMRGVTEVLNSEVSIVKISTHTPHARRDQNPLLENILIKNFNSHASCEAWHRVVIKWTKELKFQLTRLMRGVTLFPEYVCCSFNNFNSHASCEAWLKLEIFIILPLPISTHTPHARRDILVCWNLHHIILFQLTRLMRGVTKIRY